MLNGINRRINRRGRYNGSDQGIKEGGICNLIEVTSVKKKEKTVIKGVNSEKRLQT